MRDYEKLFESGNSGFYDRLYIPEHKGSWQDICIEDLFIKLRVEVSELQEAVIGGDFKDIRQEAADVANYAHMLIEACNSVIEILR